MHGLAYNLFNWFRRLALAASMRKQRIDTVRLKLMKIAARVVHSARYTTFKLCSSCPYKEEFYETLRNIHGLVTVDSFDSSIRFPKKKDTAFGYEEVLEKHDKAVIESYDLVETDTELYITERVNNILFKKILLTE